MRILATLLLLGATAAGAQAQDIQLKRVNIVEFGIYTATTVRTIENQDVAAGVVRPITDLKIVKVTTTIPAKLGTRFGVRFILDGTPKGQPVKLTYITRFPPPGLRNPDTGKTFAQNEFEWDNEIGKKSYRTYTFDNSWEAVPGEWALEFWYQGRKLGEKKFTVLPPS